MNLTLSVDEKLLERAREAAKIQGKSINQLVREYLQHLSAMDDLEATIDVLRKTSGTGRRKNWAFNRDELRAI